MVIEADLIELEHIGRWLNERYPGWRDRTADTDGDRVLAAAAEIRRLRANFRRSLELLEVQLRLHSRSNGDEIEEIRQWIGSLSQEPAE